MWCSVQSGPPSTKAHLDNSVQVAICSHVCHPSLLKQTGEYLALHKVRAMGWKFLGLLGTSASFSPDRQKTSNFHTVGTFFIDQQELMMCSKAGIGDQIISGQETGAWARGRSEYTDDEGYFLLIEGTCDKVN